LEGGKSSCKKNEEYSSSQKGGYIILRTFSVIKLLWFMRQTLSQPT